MGADLIPGAPPSTPPFADHIPNFSVVAASTANVNISSAPSTLDGVTLVAGERVLLKDQTAGAENGVYVFTAAASPLTRAPDFDEDSEFLYGATVYVTEGSVYADTRWKMTSDNVVVGTQIPDGR
jgi:phage-related tail fiber protein